MNAIWLLLDGNKPIHWAWGHNREEALSRNPQATRAIPTRWSRVPRDVRLPELTKWRLKDRTLVKGSAVVDLES